MWKSVYRFHSRVRRPDARRPGPARRRRRAPGLAVRGARAELRGRRRRERRLEDRLRAARLGAGRAAGQLPRRAARRGAWRTSRSPPRPWTSSSRRTTPAGRATGATSSPRAATDPAARARVDSGRLAEPFWYVDSPLTTADPRPPVRRPPAARRRAARRARASCVPDAPGRVGDGPRSGPAAGPRRVPPAAGAAVRTSTPPGRPLRPHAGPARVLRARPRSTPTARSRGTSAPAPARSGSSGRTRTSPPCSANPDPRRDPRGARPRHRNSGGEPPWRTTGECGDIPPKRHTQHRTPDGGPLLRGADGRGGLLLRLRRCSTTAACRRRSSTPRRGSCRTRRLTENRPLLPRHLKLHELFTGEDWKAADAVTGRRLVLGNADVRISYVVAGAALARCTATPSATSACTSSPEPPPSRRCSARSTRGRATTCCSRAPPPTAGSRPAPSRCGSTPSRPTRTSRRPSGTCRGTGSCWSTRRTASATCTGPASRCSSRAPTSRCWSSTAGPEGLTGTRYVVPDPPVRRGRLGRLPVPVHVQRRRLRADHRAGAPAAARAPGVRGEQLRDLQLRAAQGGLPPAGGAGALLPLQRRLRRGHVLLRRQLRGPQGIGHRAGLDQPAPGRAQPRPAARRGRAVAGRGVLRRAGRHGRHVPPLELGEGGLAAEDPAYAWSWSGRGPTR